MIIPVNRRGRLSGSETMKSSFFVLLMLVGFVPLAAASAENENDKQDVWERGCGDDDGKDRCDPKMQERMRGLYGVDTAQDFADRGAYLRRVMFVDGYGNDILALSFVREKGASPYVEIRVPTKEGAKETNVIAETMSDDDWLDLIGKGLFFDRDLQRDDKNGPQPICLHSWVVSLEAVDPTRLSRNTLPAHELKPSYRQTTKRTCGESLATRFAFELADFGYELFAECKSIPLETERNKVTALNTCHRLKGDRVSAGQALQLAKNIRRSQYNPKRTPNSSTKQLEQLIVHPDPNDRPSQDLRNITRAKRSEIIRELLAGNLFFLNFTGVDADHVRIQAQQVRFSDDPNASRLPIREITISALNELGDFKIYDIKAGEFMDRE